MRSYNVHSTSKQNSIAQIATVREEEDPGFVLKRAELAGVKAKVKKLHFRQNLKPEDTSPLMAYSRVVSFGKITGDDFVKLMAQYDFSENVPFVGRSEVEYESGREYFLEDFLPPLMQATNGMKFEDTDTSKNREVLNAIRLLSDGLVKEGMPKDNVNLTPQEIGTNCWATVWNFGMGSRDYISIFNSGPLEIGNALGANTSEKSEFANALFDDIRLDEAGSLDKLRKNFSTLVKPGDVVFVKAFSPSDGPVLAHALVAVDDVAVH